MTLSETATAETTPQPAHIRDVGLGLVAALLAWLLSSIRPLLGDEEIVLRLVERWSAIELITELPLYQPHFPAWYFLPEFASARATIAVSILAFATLPAATYRLACAITTPHRSLLAAALVATSPVLAVHGGWLRPYALLWATMTWGLAWGMRGHYRRATAALLAGTVIHPFGVFGPVWLAGVQIVRGDATVRRLLPHTAAMLPLPALLAVKSAKRVGDGPLEASGVSHATPPTLREMVLTPVAALVGAPQRVGYILIVGAITVGVVAFYRHRDHWEIAFWIVPPIVAIAGASYLLHPVWGLKYFGMLAPPAACIAVSAPRSRRALVAITAGVLSMSCVGWFYAVECIPIARGFPF
jgi:hypothetical protein